MLPELIRIFKCVAVKPGEHLFNPEMVNQLAARCGYLVHPDACTQDVIKFLETQQANFNTTFYKSWNQVDSLQEAEMAVLQLLHYISTYGTDYRGATFTMNDFPEEMRYSDFTILMPVTERELFDRIMSMFESGIAMSSDTIDLLFRQVSVYNKQYGWEIDPDRIKNREARALYYVTNEVYPYEPFELMRVLMYIARNNTLIINDKRTQKGISLNIRDYMIVFERLDKRHLASLATVFYRYKKIFLFMRMRAGWSDSPFRHSFRSKINAIRRMARRLHKPLVPGVLQDILSTSFTPDEIRLGVEKETNIFILIRILNYLNGKAKRKASRTFVIRNGKIWVENLEKKYKKAVDVNPIREIILGRIAEILRPKSIGADGNAVTVRFPGNIELAAPSSEKQFVGAIPYGSHFRLQSSSYIGVYWRNEWGTKDYDLWIVGRDGKRIGWAAEHKTAEILFSGDMTNADPEATEIMYCRGNWPDCTVRVNRYNGYAGSKFRIFFGQDNLDTLPLNYMVNPDTIKFTEDMVSDEKETTVAVVYNNNVYFTSIATGDGRLPMGGVSYEEALGEHFSSYISLREILLAAGFVEYHPDGNTVPDIDLSEMSKDTIIGLLT